MHEVLVHEVEVALVDGSPTRHWLREETSPGDLLELELRASIALTNSTALTSMQEPAFDARLLCCSKIDAPQTRRAQPGCRRHLRLWKLFVALYRAAPGVLSALSLTCFHAFFCKNSMLQQ